jgi:ABC-type transport system substrate-binding protein
MKVMNKLFNEVFAAWIVALALIGAIAAHTMLPKTPAYLVGATTTPAPRLGALSREGSAPDSDLPLVEREDPTWLDPMFGPHSTYTSLQHRRWGS